MTGGWRDHADVPASTPEPPSHDHPAFYAAIGDFQGSDYRRNAFTRHSQAEVEALARRVPLTAGSRVLDVGCGDGRHLRALAARGIVGVGVDVSPGLVRAAVTAARAEGLTGAVSFVVGDARRLPVRSAAVDVTWSLCQAGFGTGPDADRRVLAELFRVLCPGGWAVFTAFHALAAVRQLAPGDTFDPERLLHHHVAEVHSTTGIGRFDLWTSVHTVPGLRHLAADVGLDVVEVVGCEPGRYDGDGVTLDDPELLVVARRP